MERPAFLGPVFFVPILITLVMAGLVPAIHVLPDAQIAWMPGTPSAKTRFALLPGHDADRYSRQRRPSITAGLTTLVGAPAA